MNHRIPTYEDQMQLVKLKYARRSSTDKFDVFKYSKHVMYDYLWDQLKHMHILECRGHVYDATTKELVQLPPRKTFNYLENGTWDDVPLDQVCIGYKKYNGYMACATVHEGEIVVSTTGTVSSDYAEYAKEKISSIPLIEKVIGLDTTAVFEVVADWDKHIVEEKEGLYILGSRNKLTGAWTPHGDAVVKTLGEFIEDTKTNKTEGWMLYTLGLAENKCCKLKSDYYVGKKKLIRMQKTDTIWTQTRSVENQLPEQWKFAVELIKETFKPEGWASLNAQQRRIELEEMYE